MRRASVAIAPPEAERGGLDDGALVRALVAGEPWAAAAVWNRHAPKVFRIVARVLGPGADAEDLTQDVFASVFSKVPELRDPDALGSFVVSVTLRMLKWELRRRRVRRILHLSDSAELPEQAVEPVDSEAREALGRLYAILDTLNADDRTVFVLRHMEGMSLPEIAEAAGVSLATVKRRLSRATDLVSSRVEHDASLAGYCKKGAARDEP
ncbi:sigma-70 family RNA polymerase sigma factor [Sorangium sp. So ce296]|uniref:RNA polymerase sigma factor n=1 Tax=Sorangium sp. So ce296 TaxID=3133296 RepID=UPI003F5EC69F